MSVHRMAHGLAVLIAGTAAAVAVAACGGSSSSSTVAHSTKDPSGSTATSGSSSPITVGTAISVNSPILDDLERKQGIEAAISAINASGGINGHTVKLDFCDTGYNPNQELACARQLVSDKVSAIINPDFLADQTGRPTAVVAQAHIPVVGDIGASPAGLTSPDSFPIAGGVPAWSYGAVDNILRAGATKIALVQDTIQSSQFAVKLMAAGLAAAKRTPAVTVTMDPSSDPTFASAAAKATAGGVNGIVAAGSPTNLSKLFVALRQSGYKGLISTLSALLPVQAIQALKSPANGILLSSQTAMVSDTTNPGVSSFLADMKKYQPGAELNEDSETGWAAMELFAKATAHLTSFTPQSVLKAMNTISTPINLGIVAPYHTVGAKSPLTSFPRIVSPTIWYGVVKNGTIVPDQTKGYQNPFVNLATGK